MVYGVCPKTFMETRTGTAKQVKDALVRTNMLVDISTDILVRHPEVLPILRMSTCPPIARDRLTGLAGVPKNLVDSMETDSRIPPRMDVNALSENLTGIGSIIRKMADPDIFVWLGRKNPPTDEEVSRAAAIIADRLCGAVSDPIIRNAQEKRQLASIEHWLAAKSYRRINKENKFDEMEPGTFSFHTNVPVINPDGNKINISVLASICSFGVFPITH
jgi:hypothetical protein